MMRSPRTTKQVFARAKIVYAVTPRGRLIPMASAADRRMPSVTLDIKFETLTILADNLINKNTRTKSFSRRYAPIFRNVEKGMYEFAKAQFKSEGAYGGQKWQRLTAATANQPVQSKSAQTQRGRSRYNKSQGRDRFITASSVGGAYMPTRGYDHILRRTGALKSVVTGEKSKSSTAPRMESNASYKTEASADKIKLKVLLAISGNRDVRMASFRMDLSPGAGSWKALHQYGYISSVWGQGARPVPPRKFYPIGDIKNKSSQGYKFIGSAIKKSILNSIALNQDNLETVEEKFLRSGKAWHRA
jgi:hypothetical protein